MNKKFINVENKLILIIFMNERRTHTPVVATNNSMIEKLLDSKPL